MFLFSFVFLDSLFSHSNTEVAREAIVKSIASSELKLNIKSVRDCLVRVLFSNTRTFLLYNELEIFNTARSEAECSIENFSFIVQ